MTEGINSVQENNQIKARKSKSFLNYRTLPILGILFYFISAIFSTIFPLVLTFFIISLVCIVLGIIDLFKSIIQKQSRSLFLKIILILYGLLLTVFLCSILYFVLYTVYRISTH